VAIIKDTSVMYLIFNMQFPKLYSYIYTQVNSELNSGVLELSDC